MRQDIEKEKQALFDNYLSLGHTRTHTSVQAQHWGFDWLSLGGGGLLAVVIEPLCSLGVGEEGVARSGLGRALEWRLREGTRVKGLVSEHALRLSKSDSMGNPTAGLCGLLLAR